MDFIETTISEHIYNQGWIEGKAGGKKETAINLLKMGIDVGIIQKATGFSEEEIKQLSNQQITASNLTRDIF